MTDSSIPRPSMDFFHCKSLSLGTYECKLNVSKLYESEDLVKFWSRYDQFLRADPLLSQVLRREGDTIIYPHKSWVPEQSDKRPKILFLFGNPAPHSVLADIYFAYEGNNREHRFWKVMRELEIISMPSKSQNSLKNDFFSLNYTSPFVIGMEVLFTFPSATSEPKWSGVMGLERLFGKKAFARLMQVEKERMRGVAASFLGNHGAIIAFQKNAYNGMLEEGQKPYKLGEAVAGTLKTHCVGNIPLIGVPPTRWMHTKKFKEMLRNVTDSLIVCGK